MTDTCTATSQGNEKNFFEEDIGGSTCNSDAQKVYSSRDIRSETAPEQIQSNHLEESQAPSLSLSTTLKSKDDKGNFDENYSELKNGITQSPLSFNDNMNPMTEFEMTREVDTDTSMHSKKSTGRLNETYGDQSLFDIKGEKPTKASSSELQEKVFTNQNYSQLRNLSSLSGGKRTVNVVIEEMEKQYYGLDSVIEEFYAAFLETLGQLEAAHIEERLQLNKKFAKKFGKFNYIKDKDLAIPF